MSTLTIAYRDYTTAGRFIHTGETGTMPEFVGDDASLLLDIDEATRLAIESVYKSRCQMTDDEELKIPSRCNVSVRDNKTGRFTKWKQYL